MLFKDLFRYIVTGALIGILFVFVGIMSKVRKRVRSGVFVPYKYLQYDKTLLYYTKKIRPYYQTSKFGVSLGFTQFVTSIDNFIKNKVHNIPYKQNFSSSFFVLDVMALLSDDRYEHIKKKNKKRDEFNNLKETIQTLITDLVVL